MRDMMQGPSSYSDDSTLEVSSALPLLLHDLGTRQDDSQTQYSISKGALFTRTIDELRDYRCFETPQGWVLALDTASLQTFLWRPQDSQRIQLPSVEENFPSRCKCLLSDVPTGPSCAVLVFDLDDTQMWVCQIGASEWDSYSYTQTMFDAHDNPRERHIARYHGIAAVGGKVYYELTGYELGVIEFDPAPSLATIDVDMVDLPRSKLGSTYLVESCSELFLVVIFFDGDNVHKIAEIEVYKMDFSKPAWCKVESIGDDRVFLLGGERIAISYFGASCSAAPENGLCGNSIYFLNHLAFTVENFLHVINLEKGTKEVQRPFRDKGFPPPLRPPFWLLHTHP